MSQFRLGGVVSTSAGRACVVALAPRPGAVRHCGPETIVWRDLRGIRGTIPTGFGVGCQVDGVRSSAIGRRG